MNYAKLDEIVAIITKIYIIRISNIYRKMLFKMISLITYFKVNKSVRR